ncbi:hypothetical protein IscW_ISCW001368 [Ixodes scapularis]|uniref:Uncharacterized protein n=1 Tax=Ixodes scapularis TaxID=6945 RepID=B7P461_IXOSC|nr:hypothetical protein IscW_ISCW001368 [Ixodes scapularis]|eukprot:XP_002405331.1 hypothetical protein IscW_ISCW001368 [Ixodes scapularis]
MMMCLHRRQVELLLSALSNLCCRRGIPTQPILNGFCGDYDWDLGEKYHVE